MIARRHLHQSKDFLFGQNLQRKRVLAFILSQAFLITYFPHKHLVKQAALYLKHILLGQFLCKATPIKIQQDFFFFKGKAVLLTLKREKQLADRHHENSDKIACNCVQVCASVSQSAHVHISMTI